MQNYIGKQIDRYRILDRLGMGGMAVVYKAYDTRLERDVALKAIRVDEIPPSQHQRLMKRFEREAKAMARFSHPNIVPVHDYGEVDGTPYLVMEYIPGGTLKDRINKPIPYQQAIRWLVPVADALRYAHERNVLHRDVKPSNILFDPEDRPMLTDFGIAKVLETTEATLTGTGLGVGTPEYMAPEQWQGEVSEASDQYTLGVVLYELITGQKPYSADTPAAVAIMQATEPLAPPSGLVMGIPEEVEKMLYKALARDPQDRYENMDVFAQALRGLFAEAETSEPIMTQPKDREPEPETARQAANISESVTRDALDATPVDEMNVAQSSIPIEKKHRLPKWALWVGIGIIFVVLLGLMIGIGGNLVNMGKGGDGPLAMLAMETPTATVTPTMTTTLTPSKTSTITPTPEPTFGIGSTMINEKDKAEMVYVPSGEFQLGVNQNDITEILETDWCSACKSEFFSNSTPKRGIFLDSYWIYKYEVTNDQYRLCVNDEVCSPPFSAYYDSPQGGDYPVVNISWFDADTYCSWAEARLPTESEWEKAARGNHENLFPWGNLAPDRSLANYLYYYNYYWSPSGGSIWSKPDTEIRPVSDYAIGESPYGVLNLAGNVSEWVNDWYLPNTYETIGEENPQGPTSGETKVVRGGNYNDRGYLLLSIYRFNYDPSTTVRFDKYSYGIGFRCVISDGQ